MNSDSQPPPALGYLLRRAYLGLRRQLDIAIAPIDLTPEQYSVLFTLRGRGGLRQKEIGEAIFMDPNTVTGVLSRLEEKGHIVREPDPSDGRATLVLLTAEGVRTRRKAPKIAQEIKEQAMSGLAPKERSSLFRLLGKLCEGIAEVHE